MTYKIKKGEERPTAAHPTGKFVRHVFYNGEEIGTIRPYSAYQDKKKKGSRIVSSRKNVTRYSFNLKKEHIKQDEHTIPVFEKSKHTSPKSAFETMKKYHKKADEMNEGLARKVSRWWNKNKNIKKVHDKLNKKFEKDIKTVNTTHYDSPLNKQAASSAKNYAKKRQYTVSKYTKEIDSPLLGNKMKKRTRQQKIAAKQL